MTPTPTEAAARDTTGGVWGRRITWLAAPFLTLGYQIAAKEIAGALRGGPLTGRKMAALVDSPWFAALLLSAAFSLVLWVALRAEAKPGASFPITAFAYLLVIGASWTVFHEPADIVTILGSAAILSGVWLIGREPEEQSS